MARIEGFDVGGEPQTQVGLSGPEKRDTVPSGQRSVSWSGRRGYVVGGAVGAEWALGMSGSAAPWVGQVRTGTGEA